MADREASFARLAWTSGALAFAVAPHIEHLRPWVVAAALLIALWRLLAERRRWRLPSRALKTGIAFSAAAGVIASYRTISGVEAGTALLVVMAALKLLETRTPRDHVVLVFIGFFLCLATFLYAQRLVMLAWVVPAVWLLAAALLNVSRVAEGGPPLRPFRTTGAMLLKALPLMLVLFLFFPRVQGHFWGAPAGERAVTGLDDEMSPGDLSELTLNDSVAFRVRFSGPVPAPRDRYWRGPVLSEFDGYTWRRPASEAYLREPVEYYGEPVDYRVTLEPHRRRWLFALDMPSRWPASIADRGWDYLLYTPIPVNAVIAYDLRSYPRYRAGAGIGAAMRHRQLQLPPDRNPRALALARQMRAAAATDSTYITAVLRMFREQEYFYTLEPPRLERDSVDDFLFNTRRGFCGHFASAFTTMMRAAGLPARVVTGYQGGEFNTLGGYMMVRQSQAHAWSEVWLEGRGWTRVDPTAAVAPERVERGLEAALPENEPVPGRLFRDFDFAWQARLAWDAVNERWNDWVVEFDSLRQEQMLHALGVERADWHKLAVALGIGLAGGLLLVSAWLAWEFRPPRRDPAARAFERYAARLAARGLPRPPWEGPYDFLRRVTRYRPDLAGRAGEITELYARLRYAPSPARQDLERLRRLVRDFRP